MKGTRSLRELTRILDVDRRSRRLCLIKPSERGYTRSVISRFTRRVGAERIQLIIEEKVIWLLRRAVVEEVDAALDPSFIKAWSIRHPDDSRIGFSDSDAKVGSNGRGYDIGYKLHLSVDPRRIIPLAVLVAPANDNEKKHAPSLVERTRMVLVRAGARLRRLIGDSQFSSRKVRALVEDSVIPYTSNQRGEGILRVDRRFWTHGPRARPPLQRRGSSSHTATRCARDGESTPLLRSGIRDSSYCAVPPVDVSAIKGAWMRSHIAPRGRIGARPSTEGKRVKYQLHIGAIFQQ
jgi:hypothetical protein